jgi:hypothetical protein
MKTLNTLALEIERWDDPGDYPSGAGAGPLPSYNYVGSVSGTIVVKLESSDFTEMVDAGFLSREVANAILEAEDIPYEYRKEIKEFLLDQIEYDLDRVRVTKWAVTFKGLQAFLEVEDFDANSWEPPEPEEPEWLSRYL